MNGPAQAFKVREAFGGRMTNERYDIKSLKRLGSSNNTAKKFPEFRKINRLDH